jgi:hypothetical protein
MIIIMAQIVSSAEIKVAIGHALMSIIIIGHAFIVHNNRPCMRLIPTICAE